MTPYLFGLVTGVSVSESRFDSIVNTKGNKSSETTSNKQRWRPNKDLMPTYLSPTVFSIFLHV